MSRVLYFPNALHEELFDILDDVVDFAIHRYSSVILTEAEKQMERMDICRELERTVFRQLFYWYIFCSQNGDSQPTIYQQYFQYKRAELEKKREKVKEILIGWERVKHSFYLVSKADSRSGKVFVTYDVLKKDVHVSIIPIHNHHFPKEGEMIAGLFLPIGENTNIALQELIYFPEYIAASLITQLDTLHTKSIPYPKLLKNAFQTVKQMR
ncbi:hypothetical protein D8M04_12365 [Oceanobacillus piezotolerans]|uniref:Uncharacterized protein n=1 Tax=Oceanobacillus piezotolerans TaxID=2448030 RepID=A0A498DC59_9BACI|nr:hypothetical protein [Oceanobacillus piezotolerans]RLL43711.1 hypothetical protein D8M04_12365 [Oceanobacillus piezotolerans]